MARVAILNSRQTKTPVGSDPWIQNTLAAVDHAVTQGWQIVSSIGLNTWELTTWATGVCGGHLFMVLPPTDSNQQVQAQRGILEDFALNPQGVEWSFVDRPPRPERRKSWWAARDESVLRLAGVLMPVSVRPGGRWENLLSQPKAGQTIDDRFRIPHAPTPHHERSRIHPEDLNSQMRDWGHFLIHWTRSCHGPWPGEKSAQFYADLAASPGVYCRGALLTLKRILDEQLIRGSAWKIGGGRPVVALSACTPLEALPLLRWRARWSRWAFEPYGIAIQRDAAMTLGVQPVRYVTEEGWQGLSSDEAALAHRLGQSEGFWPSEREWRHRGALDLSVLPSSAIRVIVREPSEVAALQLVTEAPVFSMLP